MPWSCGLQMRILEGPGKGRTIPFDSETVSIGRARLPSDRAPGWIFLNDDTVSRLHAELEWDPDHLSYVLKHRSQTNPSFVNGKEVEEEKLLKVGDQLKIGASVLELQQADTRFAGRTGNESGRIPKPILPTVKEITLESATVSKQAPRKAALTLRQDLSFEVLAGPDKGRVFPVSGITITLGTRPLPPFDSDKKESDWFDQEIELGDGSLSHQCLALSWKELENGFSLWRPPDSKQAVKITRHVDGGEWVAELGGSPILIRPGDRLSLGQTVLRLISPVMR